MSSSRAATAAPPSRRQLPAQKGLLRDNRPCDSPAPLLCTASPLGREWSGRRGSNPRPSAWKADALPAELLPLDSVRTVRKADVRRYRPDSTHRPGAGHKTGGEGWIRTTEGVRQQIYSLPPLTAREPRRIYIKRLRSWSWRWDSNPQPADYKSAALPIELRQPGRIAKIAFTEFCVKKGKSAGKRRVDDARAGI